MSRRTGARRESSLLDALTPAETSDGRTIVFVSSSLELWTADASGRRTKRLVPRSVLASRVMVTPDRHVIYVSLEGGTTSAWIVAIDGGASVKLAAGTDFSVSTHGRSLALAAPRPDGLVALLVCSLPGCTSPRPIGSAAFDGPINWTPDGHVAYAKEGNLWVQAVGGGAPTQLTRFTDRRPIGSFAWSRDGKRRLAITRSTVTKDIVLFKGLK